MYASLMVSIRRYLLDVKEQGFLKKYGIRGVTRRDRDLESRICEGALK